MTEWEQKIDSVKLTKESYNKANDTERDDMLYYFTRKMRQKDNYGEASFAAMPKPLQVVYLINQLEAEVNNGGFFQFFINSSGRYVNETIESLELIEADYTKKITSESS